MTGVLKAIILAAATVLPFTPPSGWTALPQSVIAARVSAVWHGPKTAQGTQTFTAMMMPFPGTIDMLAGFGLGTKSPVKRISSVSTKLCGTPARFVTLQVKSAPKNLIQQEVAVKNGRAYMLMYTRPAGVPADPRILHVMHAFCPSGTSEMQAMQIPSGWTKTDAQMKVIGAWLGTQPGEVVTLMQGAQTPSLEKALSTAAGHTVKDKHGKVIVNITGQRSVSMCGYPGILADIHVTAGPMPVTTHFAATQGLGRSYVLMYMQMGTASPDPAAMAALKGLCVTGAAPAASASPSAIPLPVATAAPTASASPSPSPTSTP